MKQQESKNVLVTGGLGYIGSHTVVKLIENGYNPLIIDNLSNSDTSVLKAIEKITGKNPYFLSGDLRDPKKQNNVSYILKNFNVHSVIHFAAHKSVSESVDNPLMYYDNNVTSTIKLLKYMKEYGVKNIVFSSSCTVYGQPDKYPVNELTPLKPTCSPYGETKSMCEKILKDSSKEGLNVISLRYFNPIGAHESGLIYEKPKGVPENLMPYITGVVERKYPFLKVFGNDYNTKDGTAVRDYIDINDLAEAHVKSLDIIDGIGHDVINVGSGDGCSVMEIIKAFEDEGHNVPYEIHPRRNGDIEKIYGDISKAKNIMNWEPKKTIQDSVKSTLKTLMV